MRIAVLADIHANLEALRAVLKKASELRVDEIFCLGDLVGYSASPNECVDLIRNENIICMLGNHDACASGLEEPEHFNALAREALFWTRDHLAEENRRFLMQLNRQRRVHDLFLFHGSINDTNRYMLSRRDAVENFELLQEEAGVLTTGFFGHTHVRAAWTEHDGFVSNDFSPELPLLPEKRYLFNPGSVGQPRDGDPRVSFLVYDREHRTVTFFSVEYDIRACQDKIIGAGLPQQLAERLAWGR